MDFLVIQEADYFTSADCDKCTKQSSMWRKSYRKEDACRRNEIQTRDRGICSLITL